MPDIETIIRILSGAKCISPRKKPHPLDTKRLKRLALIIMIFVLLLSGVVAADETGETYNTSGIINRSVSVDPTGLTEGFSAVIYDNTNGLPTSEANAITETSDGFIWIGSYAGLIRYDGNTFERMDSTTGISSIKCLYTDSRDRLWIGTNDNGVAVLERGEMRMWGKLEGMSSAHTRAITEDENGTIYVATTDGIMTIDPEYHLAKIEEEEIEHANMRDLRMYENGVIYGTTDLGDIMTISDGKLLSYLSAEENPKQGVGAILVDPKNPEKLYMESFDMEFHHVSYVDGKLTDIETFNIEPLKYIKQLEYIDGKIWICAGNGIGTLDEDNNFTLLENLPMNNNVGHVMTDYLGNLWFTSTRQGVMKVVPNQFSNLYERFKIPEEVVNTTCMSDGKLYIGTDTGLKVLDDNGLLTSLPLKKAMTASGTELDAKDLIEYLDGARIRSIIRDSKGFLWISTWRISGLLRYDPGTGILTAFTEEEGLLSNSLRSVCEGEDGRILIAVTGGVNVIMNDEVIASYSSEDGIDNTESLTVTEAFNGDIVLGSNGGGLYIIKDDGIWNINVEEGLPSDIVMRLKRDENQELIWIVTSSAIAYMTPDYQVTTVQKFPYTNNYDLYENSKGDMWVLSSNGIYVTPSEELIANGEINPVYYSIASGLPCIATANSYSELTDDGDLYIAGSTGVAKVNIEQPFENVAELAATVPYVEADGTEIYPDNDGNFTIPSDTKKLTVPSHVFNYSLGNPQVSYQLEGFDSKVYTVSRNDLTPIDYTNLSGGDYIFTLQLKDSMGRGNKKVSVHIIKEKKLYEELWFIILSGLFIIAAIVLCVRLYIRRKTKKLEHRQKETMALISEITEAFAKVIDMKDTYTNGHSSRVAKYTTMLARELGYDEETVEKYYRIALLHDIGKIGIPGEVLNKPGKLTDEEYEIIKSHTTKGYETLKDISIMPELATGAQFHHERPDGRGYPNHLNEDEIPRVAQIIAVADCFDAMYSNRPYRNRMNFDKVVSIISEISGTQLTPDVVDAFLRLVEKGEFHDPEDHGGGSLENIENIRNREQ